MPVSKRDKKVSLTKTTKKGMNLKHKLVENIRKNLEIHEHLFVFTTRNLRNEPIKNARETWEGSRFFLGKPKVMAIALGRTEAEEQHKNLHKVSPYVRGQCGLLLTSKPQDEVLQWFKDYSTKSFARSGFVPTETIELEAGPLHEFAAAMEPHLRSLGLSTQLEKGKIVLRESHVLCTKGVPLTPEQAGVLKLLKKEIAEFKLTPICVWSKDGHIKTFKVPKDLVPTPNLKPNRTTPKGIKNGVGQKENIGEPQSEMEVNIDKPQEEMEESSDDPQEETEENINEPEEEIAVNVVETIKQPADTPELVSSPKISRSNPRRSMRTPKPIKKKTPEQKRQSVKKLTEPTKGTTPSRKSARSLKNK